MMQSQDEGDAIGQTQRSRDPGEIQRKACLEWLQLWPSQKPGFLGSGAGNLTELDRENVGINKRAYYLSHKQVHRAGRRSIWPNLQTTRP